MVAGQVLKAGQVPATWLTPAVAGYEPPPDTEGQAPAKMVITNDATLTYKVNINLKENLPGQFEKLNKVMAPNTSGKDDLDTSVVRPNTGIVVTPQ